MKNSLLNPYATSDPTVLKPVFSYHGETYNNDNERDIIKSLVYEKISQFGYKATYMVYTKRNEDKVFGENNRLFKTSFEIVVDYQVDGMDFATSIGIFGYDMQDTIKIEVGYDVLNDKIEALGIGRNYPLVGDQIYVPSLGTKGMQLNIVYVDSRDPNNPAGDSILWTLNCQAADISSETYDTGNKVIDSVADFDKLLGDVFDDKPKIEREAKNAMIREPNMWNNLILPGGKR